MDTLDQLAAALDNHQVTDDQGGIREELTSQDESAILEQTPVEDGATAEKSADQGNPPKEDQQSENEPEMVETASDETGKRYVPESRFKEVYAKWKEAERNAKGRGETPPPEPVRIPQPLKAADKADALEIEILRTTLPQFNPESQDYSRDIDELGFSLYEGSKDSKGNYTMTRIDAGRKALQMAKKITSKVADTKLEARTVKAEQSDQGITNRVLNRGEQKLDPNKMSLDEKEAWLKATGNW